MRESHGRSAADADAIRRILGAALTHHQSGRLSDAEAFYRAVLAGAPDQADALHLLGVVCLQGRRWDEAATLVDRAVTVNGRNAAYRCNLGTALRELGRWAEAVDAYATAVELNPDHLDAHYNLAVTLQDLGRARDALAHFDEALRIRPDHAEARYRRGTVMRTLGELQAAADDFHAAARLRPDAAEIRVALADALMALGDHDGAGGQYARMVCLDPGDAAALIDLGSAGLNGGRLDDAVAWYRRALRLAPDQPDARYNLANAWRDRGRPREAAVEYREALRRRPDFHQAWNNLGGTLRELNAPEQAAVAYRTALVIAPAYARAVYGLAHTLLDGGDFEGARGQFERALTAVPGDPCSWAGLASVGRMTEADRPWLDRAETLLNRARTDPDAMFLLYAMGKFHDDVGEYAAAFRCFADANAIAKRHAAPYDPAEVETTVSRIIENHGSAFFDRLRAAGSGSGKPVFIVGMPRSGTTLVEQIIASHPDAVGAGELSHWNDLVNRHVEPVLSGRLTATDTAAFARGFLAILDAIAPDARRVVDKMPGDFLWLGPIHATFPRARILHMRRHPLDVCLSILFQNFTGAHRYAYALDDIAHHYRQYHRLMAHWTRVLPPDVLLDVPYEAVVDDTAGWGRRIIEFLGLEWDDRCLDFHNTARRVTTASAWQVRQPIYKTSKQRWRNYAEFLGPTIEALGDLVPPP